MTDKNVHLRFVSDDAFLEHHRRQAAKGDEISEGILKTRSQINLGQLFRESLGRGFAKSSDIFEPDSLVQK